MATAAEYEAWYHTPRGQWIGETEFRLLRALLQPERGRSLLDIGCGTGYFTRRFAGECRLDTVGLDPNAAWLEFARVHGAGTERYCVGQAEQLPFADRSFDYTVSVTALCFVSDAREAIGQMLRVTRKRFAIGLLNRRSLLYLQKGRRGGSGAYRGARWYSPGELRALLSGLPVANSTVRSAIFLAAGGTASRVAERVIPTHVVLGGFIVIVGDRADPSDASGREGALQIRWKRSGRSL